MSSNAQINANRANSQKSTGPRTPEGKAASSGNRLKHGIYSTAILLPNEDPDAYQALVDEAFADLQPVGFLERALVQRLADCQWRMNRFDAIDAEFHQSDFDDNRNTTFAASETFERIVHHGYGPELARQWARQERIYRRAMLDLLALQKERKSAPSQKNQSPIRKLASILQNPAPPQQAIPEPAPTPDTGPLPNAA